MKSILYIMHIPWGYIKQRPQFLAEELSKYYNLDVYYRKTNRLNKSKRNVDLQSENLFVRGFRNVPFERLPFLPYGLFNKINRFIFKLNIKDIERYDYVWITLPEYYDLINGKIDDSKIIYDCMDDIIEFPYVQKLPKYKKYLINSEKYIYKNAHHIFCSAEALKNKMHDRYGYRKDISVINNAITNALSTYSVTTTIELPNNSFTYIGTISEWFNFEYIASLLEKFPDINVCLFGPCTHPNPKKDKRLHFFGSVKHSEILGIMKKSKALLMPFIVNDLIKSVDPVKLYEYIYSGTPTIAVRYGETEKFNHYVYLYNTLEEFLDAANNILSNNFTLDTSSMKNFSLENTWTSRVKSIINVLD